MKFGCLPPITVLLFVPFVVSVCLQTCVSDMQCKGFVAVNDLIYCDRNCCSSKDTVVAYSRDTQGCVGDMEGWTSSAANAYPWLAYLVADASPCVSCVGVLISQNYIMTDFDCAFNGQDGVTVNIYFNFDDPHTRQLYTPVSAYAGDDLPGRLVTNIVQIAYAGTGTPLPLTPVPINCANINPTSATLFHWKRGLQLKCTFTSNFRLGSPVGNRTFDMMTVQLKDHATCQAALSTNYVEPNNYYCIDGTSVNDMIEEQDHADGSFGGSLLMTQDSNGNWLMIGEGTWAGYHFSNPNYPGNWTYLTMTSAAMTGTPNMQTLFGATCA